MRLMRGLVVGMGAGAAGTTALNAVTYLDMALRGRPASRTPERTVEKLAGQVGFDIPGDQDTRKARLAGLAPLTGIATGVGLGGMIGIARTLGFKPNLFVGGLLAGTAAMSGTNAAMSALGVVTDPRTWAAKDWLSDALPHLAYGLITAATLQGLDRSPPDR